jgi:acyl-CoA thioesterase
MKDPFMAHLGFAVLHLAPGEAVVAGEVGEAHLNLHGTAHGGFLYALADSAFALASNSRGPAVALSCRMDYFRPLGLGAQECVDQGRAPVRLFRTTRSATRSFPSKLKHEVHARNGPEGRRGPRAFHPGVPGVGGE